MTNSTKPVFREGQRWLADNEASLGLGTLIEIELRQLTLMFPASGETRIYARDNPPLTRIAFAPGDRIKSEEQWEMQVERIEDDSGYIIYHGKKDDGSDARLEEFDLDHRMRFNTPRDRLFAGQLDSYRWFRLRSDVYSNRLKQQSSLIRGLSGARVSIIPHQIYIATEVGNRLRPRVLLADEVGLGKTIEAGLILHKQLTQGLLQRVLLVVPEPLIHQWLVEMLRKFNLHFHIMDQARYKAEKESEPEINPFLSEQLVLCSLDLLVNEAQALEAATVAEWDCLVVDEAHHLHWDDEQPSTAYTAIETLATRTPSVLLLTATPEQLGRNSHFARLKLLDPVRFSSVEQFESDEQAFAGIASLANRLLSDAELDQSDMDLLESTVAETLSENTRALLQSPASRQVSDETERLTSLLVDRHGTGRVLFRNTRRTISGFPERLFHDARLDTSEESDTAVAPMQLEANWLVEFLQQIKPAKALVICSQQASVEAIRERLREAGTQCAVFHEGMSIVERDRAAAWFSDTEDGCRLLVCSEIGSEGRNFQYLHNLVLLELPENPDLLEQRIGRLDRIGQQHNVDIHVPVIEGSRTHVLTRWYNEGLNAFEQSCRVGARVRSQLGSSLQSLLTATDNGQLLDPSGVEKLDALIEESKQVAQQLETELENGRDRLLELNSNRTNRIAEHLDTFRRFENDYSLGDFMASVFDCFGVDYEEQSNGSWIAKPSDNMHLDSFPHLPPDGLTLCFSRELALEREEITFLTWDHPMVQDVMDLVLDENLGQTHISAIRSQRFPRGIALIETTYLYDCIAPQALGLSRYLSTDLNHYLLGSNRKDYTASRDQLDMDTERQRIDIQKLRAILMSQQDTFRFLIDHSEKLAASGVEQIVTQAREAVQQELDAEIARLIELRKVNPSVREDEIDALRQHKENCLEQLGNTQARLVAIRVMFNI